MYILSIVSVLFFLITLSLFLYFVYKRDMMKTTFSLGTNVITFIESFLLTRIYLSFFGNSLEGVYFKILEESNGTWVNQAATGDFLLMISSITTGILFFLFIYWVLLIINHFLKKFIFSKIFHERYKDYTSSKQIIPLKLIMGILSFGITSFVLLFPLGTVVRIVNQSFDNCHIEIPKEGKPLLQNPILYSYSLLGSASFFDSLTKLPESNYQIKNSEELKGMITIALSGINIANNQNVQENVEILRENLHSTYLVSGFIGELSTNAALQFEQEKPFMGIEVKTSDSQMKILMNDIFAIMSDWNREKFLNDIDTVLNVYLLVWNRNVEHPDDSGALVSALEDEEFSKTLFVELFRNEDFKAMIPSFMNFGVNKLLETLKIQSNAEYIQTVNLDDLTKEDIEKEARIFSSALRQIKQIQKLKEGDLQNVDFEDMYQSIQEIQKSKLLGDMLYNLLYQMLLNLS